MSEKAKNEDRCDCEEWKKGIAQIDGFIGLAWTHGYIYTGGIFKYCPWCGKELKDG